MGKRWTIRRAESSFFGQSPITQHRPSTLGGGGGGGIEWKEVGKEGTTLNLKKNGSGGGRKLIDKDLGSTLGRRRKEEKSDSRPSKGRKVPQEKSQRNREKKRRLTKKGRKL